MQQESTAQGKNLPWRSSLEVCVGKSEKAC